MSSKVTVSEGREGLCALLSRAEGVDAFATVLIRPLENTAEPSADTAPRPEERWADAFVTTPFGVLASRRIFVTLAQPRVVISAHGLLKELRKPAEQGDAPNVEAASESTRIGGSGGGVPDIGFWSDPVPPTTGFQVLEEVPVTIVRRLADQGRALAREFSGPLGPPTSLLNRTVLTASSSGVSVEVPMRVIFTCTALGLLPGFGAPLNIPRQLRISTAPGWLRVDAPYGTLWYSLPG